MWNIFLAYYLKVFPENKSWFFKGFYLVAVSALKDVHRIHCFEGHLKMVLCCNWTINSKACQNFCLHQLRESDKGREKKRDLKEFLILDAFFMGINTIFLLAADNCVKQDNNKKTLIMWLKLEPY